MENLLFTATTMAGLEDILSEELKELGATEVKKLKRAVEFKGNINLVYKVNLYSRVALNVLLNLGNFKIYNPNDLYNAIFSIDWPSFFGIQNTFAVKAVVNQNKFINTPLFASLKAKDAIADRFRKKYNKRPNVDKDNADVKIHLYIFRENLSVSINTTGEPLFKRGYKLNAVPSPLNEILAAGIIKYSGWDCKVPFFDPFCGSGTLLIEAAMMAANLPPAFFRKNFSFFNLKFFDKKCWLNLLEEAKQNVNFDLPLIFGSDISSRAIVIADKNISNVGMNDFIKTQVAPFGDFIPNCDNGYLICNPPYGVRTQNENIIELYTNIGNIFRNNFKNWLCYVISSDEEALRAINLFPNKRKTLYNGALECKLYGYEIYNK
jgi:putative N6-adenine-specific DNA methylase